MNDSADAHAAAIALNRFGLGAKANEPVPPDPKAWLLAQFDHYDPRPPAWSREPDSAALIVDYVQRRREVRDMRRTGKDAAASGAISMANNMGGGAQTAQTAQSTQSTQAPQSASANAGAPTTEAQQARKALRTDIVTTYRDAVNARVLSALNTQTPFVERLVHFWANHFAISTEKPQVAVLAGAFEAEAIRPHVLGRFEDMLVAVERHPAMQFFLDQTNSVGPDSIAAMRAAERNPTRPRGLNENLAREIMELHTLGARSGYTQQDVTEFARAMTGWSVALPPVRTGGANGAGGRANAAEPGRFVFRIAQHEPGTRTIIGRQYDQTGEAQPLAVLHDFASSPATAHHVADKLARHFISDTPPPDVVSRVANAFTQSGGDLPTVYRALIESPQAWSPASAKFKSPWEWTISAMRGLGWQDLGDLQTAPLFTQLGQPIWRPGSPAGYDDVAASWASPDALLRRVELAQRLASRVGDRLDARTLGDHLFAGSLSMPTATAVSRAESASTAFALLFVSPDFQRR
ncbi:DUF1800 domain-containing protein [Paraburkholderia edwinii]|uniref:DUF1800 domain-containing protein n=1 Tax=Paraburkholderia edwinii TaxID=2861782 RepID=A0ABX8UGQ9_9BURK|nr:DUF1800 domain-containing protein [Paraburkholderia edwinii]QYD68009.1 DUF1800 domain-containing protein [Paraburkholderia edwinii]